jgi:glycosyltransferase involved in cell wall biosynthesis
MENPEISVIVPIYNTEKFLKECLNSIINQTFKDIEIICINDGSTDNSLKILNTYAKRDKRIKVINQKNEGLSVARNNGMNVAKGKYICFIDSDDWADKNYCKKLYTTAEKFNSDFVMGESQVYSEKTKKIKKEWVGTIYLPKELTNKSFNWKIVKKDFFDLPITAWGKIYNSEFLRKNKIRFPERVLYEDTPFYVECLIHAKKINILKKNLYFYRKESGKSIMDQRGMEVLSNGLKICSIVEKILKKNNLYKTLEKEFLNWKLFYCFGIIYERIDPKFKRIAFKKLKKSLLHSRINETMIVQEHKWICHFFTKGKQYKIEGKLNKLMGKVGTYIKKINPRLYYLLGGKN